MIINIKKIQTLIFILILMFYTKKIIYKKIIIDKNIFFCNFIKKYKKIKINKYNFNSNYYNIPKLDNKINYSNIKENLLIKPKILRNYIN